MEDSRPQEPAVRASVFHRISLLLYQLICLLMRVTDVRVVAVLGRVVGYMVWAVSANRRRIVARNLRIVVDPTLRPDKLGPMVRRNIVRTIMNLACSIKTGLMTAREMEKFIHLEGAEHFERCGSGGHTVISCIPHAGNWEALARIRPYFHRVPHFASMYRRLANPLLEEFVYKSRTRYGCAMYSKEDGLREVLKLARSGGLLGVLSDQFIAEGIYLPYFGKVTGVTPLPALIYKRCKGKGHLFSVFTRNTALGHWDTVLGREIYLPEGCDSIPDITMQVNLALEKCQNEHILDGFWMHHRWKCTSIIAPKMDDETLALVHRFTRLPFRMLVASPDTQDAALQLAPAVHALGSCRPDAQVCIICSQALRDFWQTQPGVTHVLETDGSQSVRSQLNAEAIYRDGPFDVLFMFGGGRHLWRELQCIFPVYSVGWNNHPLAKKFRLRYRQQSSSPLPTSADYAFCLLSHHGIHVKHEVRSEGVSRNKVAQKEEEEAKPERCVES